MPNVVAYKLKKSFIKKCRVLNIDGIKFQLKKVISQKIGLISHIELICFLESLNIVFYFQLIYYKLINSKLFKMYLCYMMYCLNH